MGIDRAELRKGLAETRRFLLAHHLPSERHRCYSPVVFGRQVDVCARCLGIYPSIVAGILAYLFAPLPANRILFVAILPAPALLDWSVTTFRETRGTNAFRTLTGALLGFGYGLGLSLLIFESVLTVLVIGLAYGLLAGLLLSYSLRRSD
ncbi:DUF2085 domain-containing protein [Natronosalvus halobius]|uniref:DUF2085 domain-containing protein n=1 Tax=Natronosalvus halobius TaxID=2953746 RepID=UPI0020A2128E|nr:DUF2085 domain-containing protein [Natronosalvus halobius]USZ72184.1 DUF2085 domain-containing protein [Natronosalvus halobius]